MRCRFTLGLQRPSRSALLQTEASRPAGYFGLPCSDRNQLSQEKNESMVDYLPGVVLEKDRYGCCQFAPAYCVLKQCRRANACLGNEHGPCLADERWVECLKYLKTHDNAPEWFHPPFDKEPETEESLAKKQALNLELIKRLWNVHRQLKAYPESRKNYSEAVLLMLEFVDFSKMHDDDPIPRLTEDEKEAGCETVTPTDAPVLSEPRIRGGCD